MSANRTSKITRDQSFDYQIRILGHLDTNWAEWFGNVEIEQEKNCGTLIHCHNIDQAELFRLLKKIRNLGMLLISVQLIFPDRDEEFEKENCDWKE